MLEQESERQEHMTHRCFRHAGVGNNACAVKDRLTFQIVFYTVSVRPAEVSDTLESTQIRSQGMT